MKDKVNSTLKGDKLVLEHTYLHRIGIISDLQVGCQMALMPPLKLGFEDRHGSKFAPNVGQLKLWDYWNQYIKEMQDLKIQYLFVLGDVIGGHNRKEFGRYMHTSDINSQIDLASFILNNFKEQIPSLREIWIWRGTPYHGSLDVEEVQMLVAHMKAEYGIEARYGGPYTYIQLIDPKGENSRLLWVAHPATSATVYPETVMGRDIMFFQQKHSEGKLPKIDMVIRAHKHEYIEIHKSGIRSILLPCWQFFVPYDQAVKWYPKYQPDIGGVVLLVDECMRLRPWHFTYPNFVDPLRFIQIRDGNVIRKPVAEW